MAEAARTKTAFGIGSRMLSVVRVGIWPLSCFGWCLLPLWGGWFTRHSFETRYRGDREAAGILADGEPAEETVGMILHLHMTTIHLPQSQRRTRRREERERSKVPGSGRAHWEERQQVQQRRIWLEIVEEGRRRNNRETKAHGATGKAVRGWEGWAGPVQVVARAHQTMVLVGMRVLVLGERQGDEVA